MREKNYATIVSDDKAFISGIGSELKTQNYTVRQISRKQKWKEQLPENNADCYVLDNNDGLFPYSDFVHYLQQQKTILFLLNIGQAPPAQLKFPYIIFSTNASISDISLANFLKNAGKVLLHEKAQTELASMLLHDVRSPLNSMVGYLELLLNETFGSLNEGQKNMLEKVMNLSDTTFDMLEDLNEVFRGEQVKILTDRQPFDFNKVLEEVLVNIWIKADSKNIKIRKEIEPELPLLYGEDYQIQRVLTNLITNAIKYTPENSQIVISARANPSNYAEISVSDNGQGVPDQQLPHIFDKYYRVKQKKQVQKGYGLGLYISKIIVKAHRGKIWARTNEKGGLSVTFTIPFNHS